MTSPVNKPTSNQILTEADLVLSQESGWADAGWFFSRARGRILAARIRALPREIQEERLARASELLNDENLPGGTARIWLCVLRGGAEAVCRMLEDSTDGTQAQVLRTSIPAPLWEGLMTEDERLTLMAQIRQEIQGIHSQ